MFKQSVFVLIFIGLLLGLFPNPTQAQSGVETLSPVTNPQVLAATDSATSSESAKISSPSAEVEQKIQEKKDKDLTETGGKQKTKLESYLESNPPSELSWNNFVQHAILFAVGEGVPVNVIVLVILFPLVGSLIATSRHIIGLRGFGIYIPTVLSVALVSTGVIEGIFIFLSIILTALLTNRLLKKTKLSYLPRTAIMIWTISVGLLALLTIAPAFNLANLMTVNIFPILILVLLSENFLDALSRTKSTDAVALTIETLGLAIASNLILTNEMVQRFAISEPELLLVGTVILNIIIGKFVGLRLSEFLRFRSIIEEE